MLSSSKLSLTCSAVLILLGGFVLFAWGTDNIALIQIRPELVPMSVLVAIGFFLSGLGLIVLNVLFLRGVKIIGLLTLGLGGLTFLEFILSWNGVGGLWISLQASQVSPVPPISSMCFVLFGLAVLAMTMKQAPAKGTLIAGVLGAIIFALGSMGFFAHLVDMSPTEGMGRIMRMAVHSPGGFGVLAVGLIAFSWKNEQQKSIGSPHWLPVLVGVGVTMMTFGLWIHLDHQEQSFVATAFLIFGLFMASVLAVGAFFMQRERRLLEELHLSHQGLEREIHERKQVEEHLRISQEELRNLSHRLQSIREEEKSKIAREVHDELGQVLTVLKMDLACWDAEDSQDSKAFYEKIQVMGDRLDQTVQTVQRICMELRPKILEVFGLMEAIEWQTKEFQHRTGIQCDLVMDQARVELDSERSIACFRVLQEALTNVARHAKASHVCVNVIIENSWLLLKVKDNGEGIEDNKIYHSHSLGLIGIRERVHHFGGEVSIQGKRGEGTQLSVKIPYPQNEGLSVH